MQKQKWKDLAKTNVNTYLSLFFTLHLNDVGWKRDIMNPTIKPIHPILQPLSHNPREHFNPRRVCACAYTKTKVQKNESEHRSFSIFLCFSSVLPSPLSPSIFLSFSPSTPCSLSCTSPAMSLHRVAACCSVLQRVAACCSVLKCVVVCCRVLQCVAGCCRVLQGVAVSCSLLH